MSSSQGDLGARPCNLRRPAGTTPQNILPLLCRASALAPAHLQSVRQKFHRVAAGASPPLVRGGASTIKRDLSMASTLAEHIASTVYHRIQPASSSSPFPQPVPPPGLAPPLVPRCRSSVLQRARNSKGRHVGVALSCHILSACLREGEKQGGCLFHLELICVACLPERPERNL